MSLFDRLVVYSDINAIPIGKGITWFDSVSQSPTSTSSLSQLETTSSARLRTYFHKLLSFLSTLPSSDSSPFSKATSLYRLDSEIESWQALRIDDNFASVPNRTPGKFYLG
ncbi:hypothetical protein IFR05_015546 [Cadophora sp. M221]|nr:hypothetical protein IFR05_015546 [Cadophora sp. M221]